MDRVEKIGKYAEEFEKRSAQEILGWALKKYGDQVALASSFGAEDVVLIDMMAKIVALFVLPIIVCRLVYKIRRWK